MDTIIGAYHLALLFFDSRRENITETSKIHLAPLKYCTLGIKFNFGPLIIC